MKKRLQELDLLSQLFSRKKGKQLKALMFKHHFPLILMKKKRLSLSQAALETLSSNMIIHHWHPNILLSIRSQT
jgi:hypothetical protein